MKARFEKFFRFSGKDKQPITDTPATGNEDKPLIGDEISDSIDAAAGQDEKEADMPDIEKSDPDIAPVAGSNGQESGVLEPDGENNAVHLKKSRKKWSTRKKAVTFGVLGFVFILLAGCAIYLYSIWNNPMGQFETAAQQAIVGLPASDTPVPAAAPSVEPDSEEIIVPSMPPRPLSEIAVASRHEHFTELYEYHAGRR